MSAISSVGSTPATAAKPRTESKEPVETKKANDNDRDDAAARQAAKSNNVDILG